MRFIIPFLLVFILEIYTFFALRTLTKNKFILIGFWLLFVIVCLVFYYQMSLVQKDIRFSLNSGYAIALFYVHRWVPGCPAVPPPHSPKKSRNKKQRQS